MGIAKNLSNAMDLTQSMIQLFQSEGADIGEIMKKAEMTAYVATHHKQAIVQVENGTQQGYWKTRYYVNGVRRNLVKKNRDDLIHALYRFYKEGEGGFKTFGDVYRELISYKRETELCSGKTIEDWDRYFNNYMKPIAGKTISAITEDNLRDWITKDILPGRPKEEVFKRLLYNMKSVFSFARKKRYITGTPEEFIEFRDYRKHCDHTVKREEDTYFTEDEIALIREDMLKNLSNPKALIVLFNIETGMRADEPVALHREDVHDGYIEIHRQQIKHVEFTPPTYEDVDYTKDTRTKHASGRRFPITPAIQEVLDLAAALPGESIYVFHNMDGTMVTKDSYEQYLRRHCQRLGLKVTNNHAFRKALNNNVLIPLGIPSNERAALLGHTTRTNEQNYSLRRDVQLSSMREKLAENRRIIEERKALTQSDPPKNGNKKAKEAEMER